MKKRIMIIGAQESGKSSIANWLNGTEQPLKKKQDAIYGKYTIDVPAQYLENASMYRYILTLAQTAGCVLFLQNAQDQKTFYPPNFAASFTCQVFGVVTGKEGVDSMGKASAFLEAAGVQKIFSIDSYSSEQTAVWKEKLLKQLL